MRGSSENKIADAMQKISCSIIMAVKIVTACKDSYCFASITFSV